MSIINKFWNDKVECPKCKGEGCSNCADLGFVQEEQSTKESNMKDKDLFGPASIEPGSEHLFNGGDYPSQYDNMIIPELELELKHMKEGLSDEYALLNMGKENQVVELEHDIDVLNGFMVWLSDQD